MVGFSEGTDEKLKARLRKMSDVNLLRFGKAEQSRRSPVCISGLTVLF